MIHRTSTESYKVYQIWKMIHGCKVAIYKQKSLCIIEWKLGLDHDSSTCTNYGDLVVFHYNLQHNELAFK
jgi:hypothetical protein